LSFRYMFFDFLMCKKKFTPISSFRLYSNLAMVITYIGMT